MTPRFKIPRIPPHGGLPDLVAIMPCGYRLDWLKTPGVLVLYLPDDADEADMGAATELLARISRGLPWELRP